MTREGCRDDPRLILYRLDSALNLGDCFAYALAKEMDEPLLYKARDFAHTDVERTKI